MLLAVVRVLSTQCLKHLQTQMCRWLQAATCAPEDMARPRMIPRIAARLAEFHAVPVQMRNTEPRLWHKLRDWCAAISVDVCIRCGAEQGLAVLHIARCQVARCRRAAFRCMRSQTRPVVRRLGK